MGYLELDQTEIKEDNLFQRMFWPSDHAGEADTLDKQGFWVCLGIAVLSCVELFVQGHAILAILTLLFYWLGGMGVREHSQPAAILVALAYLLGMVAAAFGGVPPGALGVIASLLLLANVRGTWIAAKLVAEDGAEAMPDRRSETFGDRLVDQMPATIWPTMRIPFFTIEGLYLLLTVFGVVMITMGLQQRAWRLGRHQCRHRRSRSRPRDSMRGGDCARMSGVLLSLEGRVALVTGGSRGIGAATVRMMRTAGARVVFSYRSRKEDADALVTELGGAEVCRAVQQELRTPEEGRALGGTSAVAAYREAGLPGGESRDLAGARSADLRP